MKPAAGCLVLWNKKVAAVVDPAPCDPPVPEGHLMLWFGEINEVGAAVLWTVPEEYCQPLPSPSEIRH